MKKVICLFLCGSLVFGLFAQESVVNLAVNPVSGLSSQFFDIEEETVSMQTSMFSLDTRTWNQADLRITRYADSNNASSFWSEFFAWPAVIALGGFAITGTVWLVGVGMIADDPTLSYNSDLDGIGVFSLICLGIGVVFGVISILIEG